MPFLIVRNAAVRLLRNENEDFVEVEKAIAMHDSYALTALLANRGRSWIETGETGKAISLIDRVIAVSAPSSSEAIWSKYLRAIARLFLHGECPESAIDDQLISDSEPLGLAPLFIGEKMEFARKRGDPQKAVQIAGHLLSRLKSQPLMPGAGAAYASGTAYFLLSNLLRAGGRFSIAREFIEQARALYRPTLLSHQIELAHCQYASAICRAMEGEISGPPPEGGSVGPEFRMFAEALLILTHSHKSWAQGRIATAIDQADQAAQIFARINFVNYARRARSLTALLSAWRHLELGAATDKAISFAPEHASIIRGMLGHKEVNSSLIDWISRGKPSKVLGMLQFASAFSPDWSETLGIFKLPPILLYNPDYTIEWTTHEASSLSEADRVLRKLMGIGPATTVPLLAD